MEDVGISHKMFGQILQRTSNKRMRVLGFKGNSPRTLLCPDSKCSSGQGLPMKMSSDNVTNQKLLRIESDH